MRSFRKGQSVRVERNATIIEQVEGNPYWYLVEVEGKQETVNVGRISAIADEARATIDTDGSILVLTNRLSIEGGRALREWLDAHLGTWDEEAYEVARSAPNGSNYHDHLCRCEGCNPQPPDGH